MHSVGEPKTAGRMMRQAVSRAAHAEKKLGARIYLVNLSGISPTHDTYDGMHPNDRGEQKIAKKYFSVVRRFAAR
jgi:lysophospholipase L1-like esterase